MCRWVAALLLLGGCHVVSGLDSFSEGAGAGGANAAGGVPTGGGGASATGGGTGQGGALPPLVDDGLVARYFLDEPTGATTVADAADDPLDLTIVRNGSGRPELVGEPGRRGAEWLSPGVAGQIFAISDGTKIQTALEGSTTATIETVLSIIDVDSGNTRLVHLGGDTESGRFSLRADAPNEPVFFLDNSRRAAWNVSLAGPRVILHLVFDADRAEAIDRAQLFVNGNLQGTTYTNAIAEGSTIDITSSAPVELHIGNRANVSDSDGRSPQGIIHYAAIYATALSSDQIQRNVTRLALSDDPDRPR